MAFENLFSSDNDYIIEANSLGRIELETEPLYEINTQKQVLFTTKLRYYALLIEKELKERESDAQNGADQTGRNESC
jgi:hypothetical protein